MSYLSARTHHASQQRPIHVPVALMMDAEDKEKPGRIPELQAVVARALDGINECRYKSECEFARTCPATC
ncbi:MAG: hypothetical protein ABI401_16360 [Candidatus Dormibacter sp.]